MSVCLTAKHTLISLKAKLAKNVNVQISASQKAAMT